MQKKCLLKDKEGHCLLFDTEPPDASGSGPEPPPKEPESKRMPKIPSFLDWIPRFWEDLPLVVRTKLKEGAPKYRIRTHTTPDGEQLFIPDVDRDGHLRDTSVRNKAARGIGKVGKFNLISALADAGNFLYENREYADDVEKLVNEYGDEFVEGLKWLGEEALDAAQRLDINDLGELFVTSVVPISTVTRAADNVADALGVNTQFTRDVAEVVHHATHEWNPVVTGYTNVAQGAKDVVEDIWDGVSHLFD